MPRVRNERICSGASRRDTAHRKARDFEGVSDARENRFRAALTKEISPGRWKFYDYYAGILFWSVARAFRERVNISDSRDLRG